MRNLLMLVATLGLVFLVACNGTSNNPVQTTFSDQNETISFAKSGTQYPSANGQGSLVFEDGSKRIFTFHAMMHPDGSVQGQGMLKYVSSDPNQRLQFQFDINCLSVDGNVAIMSGILTRIVRNNTDDSQDPIEEGQNIQFKVIDNGEGANSPPDQMSWFNHGPEVVPCDQEDQTYSTFDIDAGNIQVRP